MSKRFKIIRKDSYALWILVVAFLPGAAIYLLNLILKYECIFGTWVSQYCTLPLIPIDTAASITIGEYIYYYFTIMAIEVTAILSWALLKTSRKSNELSEAIKNKEDNRDDESVKESATATYYDLLSKISMIKKVYAAHVLNKGEIPIYTIEISQDWIKNLSKLRCLLSKREIDLLFDLYESLISLKKVQSLSDPDIVRKIIMDIADKLFIDVLQKYLWMDFNGKVDSILNTKFYTIFRKIEARINNEINVCSDDSNYLHIIQSNGKVKIKGESENGIIKNGDNTYYDENGQLIYSLKHENYKVISGQYYNYINDKYQKIFEVDFDENGIENTGFITTFYNSSRIEYQGEIKDKQFDGKGILYKDSDYTSELFNGTWIQGKKNEGVFKDSSGKSSIQYFKGVYQNGKPYAGDIETRSLHKFLDAYEYKGTISEGRLDNGRGYLKNNSIIDWDYINNNESDRICQEYLYFDEDFEPDYDEPDIPDEVKQEFAENSERWEIQREKESLQETCIEVVELIETRWIEGKPEKVKDDDLYKKYYGINPKKD